MDEKNVYKKIKDIADELCKENQAFTRADLAYELKKYGVAKDSAEVSRLVYDAYQYYRKNGNIAIAFISNDQRSTMVNEWEINHLVEEGNTDKAVQIAEQELSYTASTLKALEKKIQDNEKGGSITAKSNMMDTIVGNKGIKDLKATAGMLFDKYTKMVDYYHNSEDCVRGNIGDFMTLRSEITLSYRDYANLLIDVFGDSVKMVEPQLFEFDKIQYLDVDKMLKETELEYNRISDKCTGLISEISDDFRIAMQSSVNNYKTMSGGNKAVGVAMAGLTMFNHYAAASAKENNLRSEMVTFRSSIKRDVLTIKADLARLLIIHKSLQDVMIPKANIYLRYSNELLSSDLEEITKALYDSPEIRPLAEKKQELEQQRKQLSASINDHLQNIDIYKSLCADIEATLTSKKQSYEQAKAMRPHKPFFLLTILSFGVLKKNYNRDMYEWNIACAPVIKEYENLMVDDKLNRDELSAHQNALKDAQKDFEKCNKEIDKLSRQIRKKVSVTDDVKKKMLQHLRPMVEMLRLAREIAESKIDEKYTLTTQITGQNASKLPVEVEQNINAFTDMMAQNLNISTKTTAIALDDLAYDLDESGEISEEDIAAVNQAANQSLQMGISLVNSYMQLQKQEADGKMLSAAYQEQYDRIMSDFKQTIDKIDDKSAYLSQVMRKVNLAGSKQERQRAMSMLSEMCGFEMSDKEFDEFLNGNLNIEL